MRYLIVLATVAVTLVASSVASGGGWATVGLDPLPTGVGPGDTWNTNMTILQHGRTPLTGLSPTITITLDDDGGRSETFAATETSEPGVYAASVVFPEAGPWRIVADSTFGDSRLTYGPVLIEPVPGSGAGVTGDDFPLLPLLVVLGGLVVAAAAAVFGVRRQRRLHPAG
jgi:YtkA-like